MLPKYFLCNAYTTKGSFEKCIYKYVSYMERYILPQGEVNYIQVDKEGIYHILKEIQKQDLTKELQ